MSQLPLNWYFKKSKLFPEPQQLSKHALPVQTAEDQGQDYHSVISLNP